MTRVYLRNINKKNSTMELVLEFNQEKFIVAKKGEKQIYKLNKNWLERFIKIMKYYGYKEDDYKTFQGSLSLPDRNCSIENFDPLDLDLICDFSE